MSDTYEINERNQVVPYTSGRKCTDTRAWRDATELELDQKEEITQLERELAEAKAGWQLSTEQTQRAWSELAEARDQIEANHKATLVIERMFYEAKEQCDELVEALREAWLAMDEIEGTDRMLDWKNKYSKYI